MSTSSSVLRIRRYRIGHGDLFLVSTAGTHIVVDDGTFAGRDRDVLSAVDRAVAQLIEDLDGGTIAWFVRTRATGFTRRDDVRRMLARSLVAGADKPTPPERLAAAGIGVEVVGGRPLEPFVPFPSACCRVDRYPARRLFKDVPQAKVEQRVAAAAPAAIDDRLEVRLRWQHRTLQFGVPTPDDRAMARTQVGERWVDYVLEPGAPPAPPPIAAPAKPNTRTFHAFCIDDDRLLAENASLADALAALSKHAAAHLAHYVSAAIPARSLSSAKGFDESRYDVFCPECDRRLFSDLGLASAFSESRTHNTDTATIDHHAHPVPML